ncbi:aspartate/glutamate racemase family protein [Laceyella tengchongensis]|uniref:maleate cis-trans isomerase family protein n=1 Tax=Laceyella tengchongensis TaxID=574699 RepID=UPI00188F92FB
MEKRFVLLRELADELTEQLGFKRHFGALVPWANIAMESELPYIFPKQVVWHFSRLVPPSRTTAIDDDFLKGMIEAIPEATRQLKHIPLDVVAFGCTSASFSFPDKMAIFTGDMLETKIPIISAFGAILKVLSYYGAKRIILFTPYEEHITQLEAQAFADRGIEVIESVSLGYSDNIGSIKSDQIMGALPSQWSGMADAIVLSCTALHTLTAIAELERKFGIPIVSSNTALALASVMFCLNK